VKTQDGSSKSVGKSFGGVFGEDNRSPKEYFEQDYDFKLKYWLYNCKDIYM
jgi:hypothetical protein